MISSSYVCAITSNLRLTDDQSIKHLLAYLLTSRDEWVNKLYTKAIKQVCIKQENIRKQTWHR